MSGGDVDGGLFEESLVSDEGFPSFVEERVAKKVSGEFKAVLREGLELNMEAWATPEQRSVIKITGYGKIFSEILKNSNLSFGLA